MQNNSIESIKLKGKYYTPENLAKFLVRTLISKQNIKIFDPAYGEGSLLIAAEEFCKSNNIEHSIFGCDIDPSCNLPIQLKRDGIKHIDFINYSTEDKYDYIVMNPPYIRHHKINSDKKNEWSKYISDICKLDITCDLWAYFLVKTTSMLKESGSIGAILPWSFLQAEYSIKIREFLSDNYEKIKILCLNNSFFKDTEERVLVLWLCNYNVKCNSFEIGYGNSIDEEIKYVKINKKEWESEFFTDHDVNSLINLCINKYEFKRFGEFADIKIGVVTGANNFFVLTKDKINELNLKKKNYIPILRSSKEFCGLNFNGYDPTHKLIRIKDNELFKKYIEEGKNENFHTRTHSLLREPWYKISEGKIPDAFFPYRITDIPYLAFNDSNLQSTNSIHRVYFKSDVSEYEKKWIQLSLLSVFGQLSLESYSKIYGSGVLKIEPRSLKNAVVINKKTKIPKKMFSNISSLLNNRKKNEAMMLASNYIKAKLEIPDTLYKKILDNFYLLNGRRIKRRKQ